MRSRIFLIGAATAVLGCAEPAAAPEKPTKEPATDDLYEAGKEMFDAYAPAEIKEDFEFPSRDQWDVFAARLQRALDHEDLTALAGYETEARAALAALRVFPEYAEYADWLQVRLDYIEAAKATAKLAPTVPTPKGPQPGAGIPYYDLWLSRMHARAKPARAGELMPILEAAFTAEGVPPELAWLAEAESTLNPAARSPSGAKGLFQLMPATAQALGLRTMLPDERADAEKSARAAARYLKTLYGKFGDWPLAFAAYNAGEGRVRRLMTARKAQDFSALSSGLPSETRMYVPKVCATIAVRAGVAPEKIPAPHG